MRLPRWTLTLLLTATLVGAGATAHAQETVGHRIAQKAVRGLDNTLFGLVADWPKTIYYESVDNGVAYGAAVGFVEGLAVGLVRTGVGLYELATSPFPYPDNYAPILYPRFSLQSGRTRVDR